MTSAVTGERVVTAEGGFNPTWQRHVAAYALCAPSLGPGQVADIGCGVGHSHHLLAPRETVGIDLDRDALAGQDRPTVVADMRSLPFADAEFGGAISVHSIEHVPDADRAVREIARVVEPSGTVVFVTPNRLTFAKPDEIIDPYHFVEYDPLELERLVSTAFRSVSMAGVFGSERYRTLVATEHDKLERLLALDPLRARRLLPRQARRRLYDWRLGKERAVADPQSATITVDDFSLATEGLDAALDVVAICREPRAG